MHQWASGLEVGLGVIRGGARLGLVARVLGQRQISYTRLLYSHMIALAG